MENKHEITIPLQLKNHEFKALMKELDFFIKSCDYWDEDEVGYIIKDVRNKILDARYKAEKDEDIVKRIAILLD